MYTIYFEDVMLEVRVIRACAGHFRYRVPPASRGRQEPPQAVEFLPWDALGPPVSGVPGGRVMLWGVLPKCDVTKIVFLVLGGRVCGCLEDI